MKGSSKQVEWAMRIKAEKQPEIDRLMAAGNEMGKKAVGYINGLDSASFWIDHRFTSVKDILRKLITTGLDVYGDNYDAYAKMDTATGVITLRYKDIVQDGKGGHIEDRVVVVGGA